MLLRFRPRPQQPGRGLTTPFKNPRPIHKNLIANFVDKTTPGSVRANAQRMRSTWLVTHLSSGSPPKALVEAAGVDSLEALTRFLRFVPDLDPAQARRRLRDAYQEAGEPS